MKLFVAILALVGAAAADVVVDAPIMAPGVGLVMDERAIPMDNMRVFSLYGAPAFARDAYLEQEKHGVKGLFNKPVVVAFKNAEKNALEAYLLRDGFMSLYTMPEFGFMRNMLLSGPMKAGLMLSAARYLDVPELNMMVPNIKMAHDTTLSSVFRMAAQDVEKHPWVLVTEKDVLRSSNLDKLIELGQLSVFPDKLQVLRDFSDAVQPSRLALEEPFIGRSLHATRGGYFPIESAELDIDRPIVSSVSPYRLIASRPFSGYRYASAPLRAAHGAAPAAAAVRYPYSYHPHSALSAYQHDDISGALHPIVQIY